MTRMRESMPVILFGLLIAFLITIIFEWGMDYLGMSGGQVNHVGEIEGSKISLVEFNELVNTARENHRQQTGAEPDDNTMRQLRQQVWDQLVTQKLVEKEIKRLGLTVPDQEIVDWVKGENPPEDLKRNFIDSTGQFRRDVYDQFLSNPDQFIQGETTNAGTKWLADYERNLRQRRLSEKLQSLLTSSVRVQEGEMLRRFRDQNIKYNTAFAFFEPNTFVKDEEVSVTDDDIKAFYQENLELYKVEATRKLKYVTFLETPTAADSADAFNEVEDDLKRAQEGADFLSIVATRSEKPDSGAWFKHGELGAELEGPVFSGKVGDIVGPVRQFDGFHLVKILDERKGTDEYVKASHVLIQIPASAESTQAKATAADVARRARAGENFGALAAEFSKDPSNAQKGGDLGWFTKGRMVKEFEEAAFKGKVGDIVGPVRTSFGLHIIKITGRDARELKLARIISKITPSPQTLNDIADRARDFSIIARESDFTQEASSIGAEAREAEVQKKGGFIPGIGVNESVTRWAFDNKVGSVSDPYTIPNGWAVFTVVDATQDRIKSFEEMKETLKPQVLRKKKLEKVKEIAAQAKAKLAPGDSLARIASIEPRAQVQTTNEFLMSAGAPNVGRDLAYFGATEVLETGQISPPVIGQRGVYLIQLLAKTPFDSTAYAAQRETLRSQMLQEKRNRYITEWLTKAKETAKIEDNRDLFFR